MKQPGSRGVFVVILFLVVVIFLGVYLLWSTVNDVFQPVNPARINQTIPVTITRGESTAQIAADLQRKGLIKNALAFRIWARIKGLDKQLQAGVYTKLSPGMTVSQIVDEFLTAQPDAVEVIVIEGWRIEQIAQKVAQFHLTRFKEADFLKYAKHPDQFPDAGKFPILNSIPAGQSMEGLLFPATYDISVDATATTVLDKMLQSTTDVVKAHNLDKKAQQHNLTLYQAFILASLVQREVRFNEDMGGVASVNWNRVNRPNDETAGYLSSDPSVQYARDMDDPPKVYWTALNDAGTKIAPDSLWNTYTHQGWPPTPICSPGLNSLLAAANPPQTGNYFFLMKKDGHTVFEKNFAQFQADVQKYIH